MIGKITMGCHTTLPEQNNTVLPQFIANLTFPEVDQLEVIVLKNDLGFEPVFNTISTTEIEILSNSKFTPNRVSLAINNKDANLYRSTPSKLILTSPASSLNETTIQISIIQAKSGEGEFRLFSDEFSDEFI